MKLVASIAAFNDKGQILFARRADTKKWTLPGGHLNRNESPDVAAERELLEETGLSCGSIQFLGWGDVKEKGIRVYSFKVEVDGDDEPENCNDPDEECEEFRWVDVDNIPKDILQNLHHQKNITLALLGIPHNLEKPDATAA